MLPFSQSEADYLISARKIIHRVVEDNTSGNYRASASPHSPPELRITYEIRRKDNPGQTIKLQFHARKEQGARWGTSLKWKNVRVRGLDYKLREDVIRGGLIVARLSHWHEHVWTGGKRGSEYRGRERLRQERG